MVQWTLGFIAVAAIAWILAVAFSISVALNLAIICLVLAVLLLAGFLFEHAASA